MNILKEICEKKLSDVNILKAKIDYESKIKTIKQRNFLKILTEENKLYFNLIAEIKKKSPSKGVICENFSLIEIAESYKKAGAKCLSVLTEKHYFGGDINFINQIKKYVDIPILRKDFIIDEWQIYESLYFGADCILLILAILDDKAFSRFYKIANEIGLDVICEVHNQHELNRALKINLDCIGINNRNLKTLEININTFDELAHKVPENIIKICESGIHNNNQVKHFIDSGANAFLVGESLMKSNNIYKSTQALITK